MDPPRKRNKKQKNTGKSTHSTQHPNGVKRENQPKAPKVKPDRISPPKKISGPAPTSRSSRSSWVKTSICLLLFSVVIGGGFCAWYMWDDGVGQLVEHWWTKYGFPSKDVVKVADQRADSVFEETYNFQKNDELFNERDEPKSVDKEFEEEDEIRPDVVEIFEDIIHGSLGDEVEPNSDDQPIEFENEAVQEEFFKHIDNDQAIPETVEEQQLPVQERNHLPDDGNHEVHARYQRDAKKLSGSHIAEEKYSRETSSPSSQAVRKPDKGQVDDESEDESETNVEIDSEPEDKEGISVEAAADDSLNKETIAAQILEGIQKGSSKPSDHLENERFDVKESIAGQIVEEIDKKRTLDLKESIAGKIVEEIDKKSTLDLKASIADQILDEIKKHGDSGESLTNSQETDPNASQNSEESSQKSEADDEVDTSDFSIGLKDDFVNEIPVRTIEKDAKLKKYQEVKKAKEEKISKLNEKDQAKDFQVSGAKEQVTTNEPDKVNDGKLESTVVEKNIPLDVLEPKKIIDQDKAIDEQRTKQSVDIGKDKTEHSKDDDEFKPSKGEPKSDTSSKEDLIVDQSLNQMNTIELEAANKEQTIQKEKITEDEADITDKNVKVEVRTSENKEQKVDGNINGKTLKEDKQARMQAYVHYSITNELDYEIRMELDAADKLLDSEKFEDALKKFEELASKYPQSPRAIYGKALAYNGQAEKEKSNNLLELCIAELEKILDIPDVPDSLFRKAGDLHVDRCRFRGFMGSALKYQKKLVERFPKELDLQNQLGVIYLLLSWKEKCKAIWEKVLEVDPNNGFAKVHLGFVLKTLYKDVENGVRLMEEGIATKDEGTNTAKFYYHLGDGLQRLNKTEVAYKVYEEAAQQGLFLSKYQRSLYNVNNLTGRPWWKPEETGYQKFLKLLQDNWPIIRDEGLAQMNESNGTFIPETEDLTSYGDWKQFTLYAQGHKKQNSCMKVPKTCSIIDQIPAAIECKRGQIKFSLLQPGTRVRPHTGPTNCRLRVHLGLVVSPGAHIRVGNDTRTWEEGQLLIFDDSFEHEVWHDGTKFRLVLIVDFWHPELTALDKQTLTPI